MRRQEPLRMRHLDAVARIAQAALVVTRRALRITLLRKRPVRPSEVRWVRQVDAVTLDAVTGRMTGGAPLERAHAVGAFPARAVRDLPRAFRKALSLPLLRMTGIARHRSAGLPMAGHTVLHYRLLRPTQAGSVRSGRVTRSAALLLGAVHVRDPDSAGLRQPSEHLLVAPQARTAGDRLACKRGFLARNRLRVHDEDLTSLEAGPAPRAIGQVARVARRSVMRRRNRARARLAVARRARGARRARTEHEDRHRRKRCSDHAQSPAPACTQDGSVDGYVGPARRHSVSTSRKFDGYTSGGRDPGYPRSRPSVSIRPWTDRLCVTRSSRSRQRSRRSAHLSSRWCGSAGTRRPQHHRQHCANQRACQSSCRGRRRCRYWYR